MDEFKEVVSFPDVLAGLTIGLVLFFGVRWLFRFRRRPSGQSTAWSRDAKPLNAKPAAAILRKPLKQERPL